MQGNGDKTGDCEMAYMFHTEITLPFRNYGSLERQLRALYMKNFTKSVTLWKGTHW